MIETDAPGSGSTSPPTAETARVETPRDRLWALSEQRQGKLLDPAENEFAERGFDGASLNRILSDASMSKGQAYYYIRDKADLYGAVVERAARRFLAKLDFRYREPTDTEEFWHLVGDLFAGVTAVLVADERLATLARGIYEGREGRTALAELLDRLHSQMRDLVVAGRGLGAIRSDVPESLIAEVVFAASREIDRWFAEHWDNLTDEEAVQVGEKAFSMIRSMCEPPEPDRSKPGHETGEAHAGSPWDGAGGDR